MLQVFGENLDCRREETHFSRQEVICEITESVLGPRRFSSITQVAATMEIRAIQDPSSIRSTNLVFDFGLKADIAEA